MYHWGLLQYLVCPRQQNTIYLFHKLFHKNDEKNSQILDLSLQTLKSNSLEEETKLLQKELRTQLTYTLENINSDITFEDSILYLHVITNLRNKHIEKLLYNPKLKEILDQCLEAIIKVEESERSSTINNIMITI